MGRKERTFAPGPGDVGHSFVRDDAILNYKPRLDFIQPAPEEGQGAQDNFAPEQQAPSLDDARNRVEDLIKGFEGLKQLAEAAQARIDRRVNSAGGMTVQLDSKKDATVISAIKRHFPKKADPTNITYDEYKECLKHLSEQSPGPLTVSDADIQTAKSNPLKTDFGGLGRQPGQNRTEVNAPTSAVEPLDLEAFQAAGVVALFALLLPLIAKQDDLRVLRHLAEAPHNPL